MRISRAGTIRAHTGRSVNTDNLRIRRVAEFCSLRTGGHESLSGHRERNRDDSDGFRRASLIEKKKQKEHGDDDQVVGGSG